MFISPLTLWPGSRQCFLFFVTKSQNLVMNPYLIFNGQKLYLSAIKDLYNNEIVAYHISSRNDIKLVLDTLKKAIKKRNVNGLLLHSDQGFQYTSRQYNNLLKRYNIKASMSRKGNCLDNACMENFFSHFKAECFHLYSFRTAQEVKDAVNYHFISEQKRHFFAHSFRKPSPLF